MKATISCMMILAAISPYPGLRAQAQSATVGQSVAVDRNGNSGGASGLQLFGDDFDSKGSEKGMVGIPIWVDNNPITIWVPTCVPSDDPCKTCGEEEIANGCVHLRIKNGPDMPGRLLDNGYLLLHAEEPSPSLYSPQALKFVQTYHITQLHNRMARDVYEFVVIQDPAGTPVVFRFKQGESIAVPFGAARESYKERLVMVDAEGWAVTDAPTYYDLHNGNGECYRFVAFSGSPDYRRMILYKNAVGREEHTIEARVDVVRDQDQILRQIKSDSQLIDIVVLDAHSYSIRIHPSENVHPVPDAQGLYTLIQPDEEPLTEWIIANPEPESMDKLIAHY